MKKKLVIIVTFLIFIGLVWFFFHEKKPTYDEFIQNEIGTKEYNIVYEYEDESYHIDIVNYQCEHEVIDNETSKSNLEYSNEYAIVYSNKETGSVSIPWLSENATDMIIDGLYIPALPTYSIIISNNSKLDSVKLLTTDKRVLLEEKVTNPYYLIINPFDKKYNIEEGCGIEFNLYAKNGTQIY